MSVPGAAPGTKRVKPQSLVQEKPDVKAPAAGSGSRKPDRAAHDVEVKTIDAEIDSVKAKNDQLRAKISAGGSNGSVNEERQKIRDELNSLRSTQAGMKANRGKTQDQIKSMQERMQSRIKDLNAARGKFPYKSGAEVDAKIAALEKQVESGNLKLVDERKTLAEISTLRKSRKTVDGFAAQQAAIEEDRKAIDAAKAKLDDPEAKAASDKYNDLKAQLDKLTEQADEAYKGRSKLYEQRDAYKKQLDELYAKRRELKDAFRAANDAYFQKMNEERTRRAERQKAEKAAYDEAKRKEVNEQLLEEASQPAYEREIEDCSTLIDYFSRGGGKSAVPAPQLSLNQANGNAPKLPAHEIRKVDAIPEGATVLKKKGDDEEGGLFGGFGGGKKNKKGRKAPAEESSTASAGLNLPMSILSALLALEIPSPISSQDITRTVDALQEKQKWFKENQAKATEERIAAAKARIERATKAVEEKSSKSTNGKASNKKVESIPTLEHRDSSEPMKIGTLEASEAAQSGSVSADETTNNGEPTAVVNGEGESLNVEASESQ